VHQRPPHYSHWEARQTQGGTLIQRQHNTTEPGFLQWFTCTHG
jgi:hypothetical protein